MAERGGDVPADLEAAPAAEEAAEAAINAAYAYKQAGDGGAALEVYEVFVREGGRVLPTLAADPRRHSELAKMLAMASQEQAKAYVLFFDYPRAAASFHALAADASLGETERRDAAQNALLLFAALGDVAKATEARARLLHLSPSATQKADADALVGELALRAWDSKAPDEGSNRAARRAAQSEMERWLSAHKGDATALAHTVRIGHHLAELRRAGREPRAEEPCKQAIQAFERLRATDERRALGSREADMAAECSYRLLDWEIGADFDREAWTHRYKGTVPEIKKAFLADLERANGYARKLDDVAPRFSSPQWASASKARLGSLYDACWTALFRLRAPELRLFTAAEVTAIRKRDAMGELDDDSSGHQERRVEYQTLRALLLDQAARAAVLRYGQAVLLARRLRVHVPEADAGLRRLAYLTEVLGDSRMRIYTADLPASADGAPFAYRDAMFLLAPPGMTLTGPPELVPAPAPSGILPPP